MRLPLFIKVKLSKGKYKDINIWIPLFLIWIFLIWITYLISFFLLITVIIVSLVGKFGDLIKVLGLSFDLICGLNGLEIVVGQNIKINIK